MEELRKAYRTTVIIGLALMASLVVYLVVVSLIDGGSMRAGEAALAGPALEVLRLALLGAAAVIFAAIRLLTRRILSPGTGRAAAAGSPPNTGPLVTAAVVAFALCELPAVLGLVLYLLGRHTSDFYLFLLVSMFFFSSHFPRFSQWEEWYRQQGGGRGTGKA